jgi:hypothetical protein
MPRVFRPNSGETLTVASLLESLREGDAEALRSNRSNTQQLLRSVVDATLRAGGETPLPMQAGASVLSMMAAGSIAQQPGDVAAAGATERATAGRQVRDRLGRVLELWRRQHDMPSVDPLLALLPRAIATLDLAHINFSGTPVSGPCPHWRASLGRT